MLFRAPPINESTRGRFIGHEAQARFPSPRNPPHIMFERKGIPMVKMRSFVSNYSPMFALFAAIVGLYTMAVCIGCGIGVAV